MNNFQTIKYSPLFLIIFCLLAGCLFIHLKQNSSGLEHNKFSTNVIVWSCWEKSCHSEDLVENEEDGNLLVEDLVNMVDGVEQFQYLTGVVLAEYGHRLSERSTCFPYWRVWGVFLEDVHAHRSFWEYKSALSNCSLINNAAVLPLYTFSCTVEVGSENIS